MEVPTRRPAARGRPSALVRALAAIVARFYLRRPDMAEVIAIRYQSLRAFLAGLLNEIAYRRGWRRAPLLLAVNFELTNRCNLRCTFCPTGNGTLRRARGFMSAPVFGRALQAARPLEFVLLFQWGEPLLHPSFARFAAEARRAGARTFLTTNGTLLDDGRVKGLLDAGVDRVTVSVDGDAQTHERVRGIPLARTEAGLDRLLHARDASRARTAIDVSMVVAPETEEAAARFEARYRGRVDRVQRIPLLTHGQRRTRCREPWRGGLVVLQDGRVTACCVDHDGELEVGDVRRESLRAIWNGERMQRLRRAHVEGDLPAVCARCTEYPTDAAAPRFSTPAEASSVAPHRDRGGRREVRAG